MGDVSSRDKLLMIAYTLYIDEICSKCGYPVEVCRNKDVFEAVNEICHASKAVEEALKGKENIPGLVVFPEKKDNASDSAITIPEDFR